MYSFKLLLTLSNHSAQITTNSQHIVLHAQHRLLLVSDWRRHFVILAFFIPVR